MSKIRVHVFSKIPNLSKEIQLALPSAIVYDVLPDNTASLKDAEIIVGDFDLMIPHIYHLPQLKWLQGTWAGVDKIFPYINKPLPFLCTRYSGRYFGQIMSEYVITQIVCNERDFSTIRFNQQQQIWCQDGKISDYRVISDLTIGILGLGTIGSWIGRCLSMFGAKILGYGRKTHLDPAIDFLSSDCYYSKSGLSDILRKSDYIINVLPATSETTGLLNGSVLKNCEEKKPIFINIGRGNIIKEDDLVQAIKNGWISKAILDVFEVEPLPKDSVLWSMKEVAITPHIAATSQARHVAEQFKENVSLYLENKPISTAFNFGSSY
ncbi:hypothetical protein RN001_007480 [Aquatica leii]|uniref:D-isomer specific 2-hydroxyacid dehydrogenase NAD-binding domain-containing protein n=1 Tax=Aquatica leii TaxID=1421715 RepID=A0AAN7PWE1_9COLE|nr:hypothetical protein RN001_007480 [Aquatica leii]